MLEGVVNVLKPPGMTSSDVVADIRHIFGVKRVGHTGTLDPGAAGVLGVCLGRATRFFDLLVDKQKTYICELALGVSTDTQDAYGAVVATAPVHATAADVRAVLPAFVGDISQTAPLYSALKVDGKALYAHARAGSAVERKTRTVTVHEATLLGQSGPDRYLLRVVCERGTYIRTICEDVGARLGLPAYMSFLLRTQAGPFCIEDAYTIQELRDMREAGTLADALLPPDAAVGFLPALAPDLPHREARLLKNGAEISTDAPDGLVRLYLAERFIGVGEVKAGRAHVCISFLDPEGGAV